MTNTKQTEGEKLRECPFCEDGGDPQALDGANTKIVVCWKCGANASLASWNRRSPDQRLREVGEVAMGAFRAIDKLAYNHVKGGLGKAQDIARVTLAALEKELER